MIGTMTGGVFLAVLGSALLHATWNAMARGLGAKDPLQTSLMITAGGAVAAVPLLLAAGLPGPASYAPLAASVALHIIYFILVGLVYRGAGLGLAYPITRGSAPAITSLLSFAIFGEVLSLGAAFGVALVASGVVWLGLDGARSTRVDTRTALLIAATAAVIVIYTLVDGAGARLSGNAFAYVFAMMLGTGIGSIVILVPMQRGGAQPMNGSSLVMGLVGGVLVMLSYGIALWAMTSAPIGLVSAVRETSVLFGVLIARLFLGETVGAGRWLAAATIVAGLASIRMS